MQRRRRLGSGVAALLLGSALVVTIAPAAHATTVPDAPSSVTATGAASGNSITVTWNTPSNDGGSAITGYTITPSTGSPVNVGTAYGYYTFTGLDPNTDYTFTVKATNAAGSGANSSATPKRSPIDFVSAVTTLSATPGNGQATVTWNRPHVGTNEWAGYMVNTYNSSGTLVKSNFTDQITEAATANYTVTGLTNGSAYTFKVYATTWFGEMTSDLSAATNSVTPHT